MTRELQIIVDNMDDAVAVRDLEGRVVLANAAAAAMVRAETAEEMTKTALSALWERFAFWDADGRPLRDEQLPWQRVLRGEQHVEPLLLRRVVRETGEQQWLLNKATPIRDPTGG
jgi:PAS domain-containing protein